MIKFVVAALILGLIAYLLFRQPGRAASAPTPMLELKPDLEQQLAGLSGCGIRFNRDHVIGPLLEGQDWRDYEEKPWELLLYRLGSDIGDADFRGALVADLWHLDTECIEGPGDYLRIARGFARLAGGALPLTDIRDHVDVEAGKAWLKFRLHDREYHWDAAVNDDWLDPAILSRFVSLLAEQGSGRRYAVHSSGFQDMLLLGTDEKGPACLRELTGMDLQWLE